MKNFWIHLLKPKGIYAKWLVLFFLVGILYLTAQGHFAIAKEYLDTESLTFKTGKFEISAYMAIKALMTVIAVFWITAIITDVFESRVNKASFIRLANRTIILKIGQIIIYLIAGLIILNIIGIDLTALAVFSGALGIGLGFGLQKIASNFISGLILLFEKSIEQNDLVELADGTFGFIRKSSARFILIETFDGKEILVPNEDFITNRVTNWTYSNTHGRVEMPIGVSYGSDLEKVHELILEAAMEHPRCITEPEPQCYLREFGDSSVNFLLYFWVGNVADGRWNVQSDVMFTVWNKFKEHNIEIPFPQRDLTIKNIDQLKNMSQGKATSNDKS